jgi:hypothetical protein
LEGERQIHPLGRVSKEPKRTKQTSTHQQKFPSQSRIVGKVFDDPPEPSDDKSQSFDDRKVDQLSSLHFHQEFGEFLFAFGLVFAGFGFG